METIFKILVAMPDYALSYLINGDDSGLDPEDKKAVDNFMKRFYEISNYVNISLVDENAGFFCKNPAFGLPCKCYECSITCLK